MTAKEGGVEIKAEKLETKNKNKGGREGLGELAYNYRRCISCSW